MLGSGSRGNATLVEAGGTRLLVDCGFALREFEQRCTRLGAEAAALDAILVTHEHSDHVGGVARLARAYGIPVYLTRGTASAVFDWAGCELRHISPHEAFRVGAIEVQPFPVPHDAREPCQFVFGHAGRRLGVASDLGRITSHVAQSLAACDALLLEFNHDVAMLASGPYPEHLKRRVGGGWGHLSNDSSAALLRGVERMRLQHLVLTHLSEKNNRPDLALGAAQAALEQSPHWCLCASQDDGLGWREVV